MKYILIIFLLLNFKTFAKENFFQEAKVLFDKGKIQESKFLFQRNIVYNPKDSKSYLYLAKIFEREENEIEKENLFPKSLSTQAIYTPVVQNKHAVPDVRGLSLLQAKVILRQYGYQTKFSGSGQVLWQTPKPGTIRAAGSICSIGLQ